MPPPRPHRFILQSNCRAICRTFINSLYLGCYNSPAMKGLNVVLLLTLLALTAAAQGPNPAPKPNLSGTWIFSAQKSSLKVPAPTRMTLQIDQSDPQIRLARTQVYGDQNFDWKLEAVVDREKEVVQDSPAYTANIRVYWEGSSLVLDQKITAPDGTQATDVVTYSLADNGKTLQAVERQATVGGKGSTNNKWVYDKQGQ
jgi:hypothetical protein